jgi:hypothetical protein
MFLAYFEGGALRWWAVVVAIVALSPVPLAFPSGIALATIWLMGLGLLVRWSPGHAQPALEVRRTLTADRASMTSELPPIA